MQHCVSVADTLWSVAPRIGIDREKAVTAGLLHDMCKGMGHDALLNAAESYGLQISPVQRKRPSLLHGHVAAEEARRERMIDSDDVYEAIAWHVTGRRAMGALALALYYADFSEPLRTYEQAEAARQIFERHGLQAAVQYIADQKVRMLFEKGALVDDAAHDFRNWLERGQQS